MSNVQLLERRLALVEARLAELESSYGETLYKLRRHSIKTDLRLGAVLSHLGLDDVSEEQIDAVLEEES